MSFADEFPNDNPELFAARLPTAGHLLACAPAPMRSTSDLDDAPPARVMASVADAGCAPAVDTVEFEVVDAFDDADFEGATLESIPPPVDSFSLWVETLRDVALAHGATADAAGAIADLLTRDPVAQTWKVAILGGEADFSACGAETLDEWSAHLVTRVANAASSFESVRRELRGRGVCAFGLVEAA